MADTIRKQILDSFITHLRGEAWIFGAVSVNPGKKRYLPSELPGISVFAESEAGEKNAYARQDNEVAVEVVYFGVLSRDAAGNKTDVFDQIEVVRGQLLQSALTATLNDLADPPIFTAGDVEYPAAEDQAAQISVMVTINYETELRDPYTQ